MDWSRRDGNGASALVGSSPSSPRGFTAINSPTSGPSLTSQPTHPAPSSPPISGRGHNLAVAESLGRIGAAHVEHGTAPAPPAAQKQQSTCSAVTAGGTNHAPAKGKSACTTKTSAQSRVPERLQLTKPSSKQVLTPKNTRLSTQPGAASSAVALADVLANAVVDSRNNDPTPAYQSRSAETGRTLTSAHSEDSSDLLLLPTPSSWTPINTKTSYNDSDWTRSIHKLDSSNAQQSLKRQKLSLAPQDSLASLSTGKDAASVSAQCGDSYGSSSQLRHCSRETHVTGYSTSHPTRLFGNAKDRVADGDFTNSDTLSHTAVRSFGQNSPSTKCHDRLAASDTIHEEEWPVNFDDDLFDGIEDDELLMTTPDLDFTGRSIGSQNQSPLDADLKYQLVTPKASCETYFGNNASGSVIRFNQRPCTQVISSVTEQELPTSQCIDMKPIVRPPFPAQVRERSPIIGLSPVCLSRTCFRIGEAINAGKSAARNGKSVILELYARILSSTRDDSNQHFVFGDLFHSKPPYLEGECDAAVLRSTHFHHIDTRIFLGQEHHAYRCIAKMKQRGKEWVLVVLNMCPVKQEDILWVEGIVNY